jgi:hypothetical protein
LANFGKFWLFRQILAFLEIFGVFWKFLDFLENFGFFGKVAVCHFGGYMTQSIWWCEGTYVANYETYRVGSEKPGT